MDKPLTPAEYVGVYHRLSRELRCMSDMWRAVIGQAIRDMDLGGRRHRNEETIRTELDALQWIDSDDFYTCCMCALIDPVELSERLKEIIAMRQPYRRLLLRDLADLLRDPPPTPVEEEPSLDGEFAEIDVDPLD